MGTEPWLRGPLPDIDPMLAPILYCFTQAKEDLAQHTGGLTREQIWARPYGLAPVGFHLRHIAGSVERLVTYLQGRQLSPEQLAALEHEMDAGASREELLAEMEASFEAAIGIVREIEPSALREPLTVGRKQLPTTIIGLLTHLAEHTARHVGEAISAAKLARVTGPSQSASSR